MATEKDIFELYCASAITKLFENGMLRDDYDWDVFRRGREVKYVLHLYNGLQGEQKAYFVMIRKEGTIFVMDDISQESREFKIYDETGPEINRAKVFADFVCEFAKECMQ